MSPAPRRLLVTVLTLGALLGLQAVPLPGVRTGIGTYSVGALGLMPWVTACLVVELLTLTRDEWRTLRTSGPEGRARILKWTNAVWLVVTALQAYAFVVAAEAVGPYGDPLVAHPGAGFRIVTGATLVAGAALYVVGARLVAARGMGNAVVLLTVGGFAWKALGALDLPTLASEQSAADVAPTAAVLALVAYAAYRLLPSWRGSLPVVVSGLGPVAVGTGVVTLAGLLPTLGLGTGTMLAGLATPGTFSGVVFLVGVTVAMTWLYAHVQHQSRYVAPVLGVSDDEAVKRVSAVLPIAIATNVGVALVFALGDFGVFGPRVVSGAVLFSVVAVLLDLRDEWRAHTTLGEVEVAWPLQRLYELPGVLARLEAAGIPARARGVCYRHVTQFFAPYAPIEVLVPRGRVAEAQAAVRSGPTPGSPESSPG